MLDLLRKKRRVAAALVATSMTVSLLAGCGGGSNSSSAPAKNVILIIGDGFQNEHERAYNNYLTGSYDSGLRHQTYGYKGVVTTWDITTYNRYAYTAGAPTITNDKFDPFSSTFTIGFGYDTAQGGALPYPQSALAAVNSTAALNYYGAKLKYSDSSSAAIPATDSASAATALATGFKTDDGNLAWRSGDKTDGKLKTIAEMVRSQKGGAFGVVTTVPVSHATPAGFVSHNVSRNNYQAISKEIITEVKPDVVIGAGHPDFSHATTKPSYNYIAADEYTTLKSSTEYVFAERQAGVDGGTTLLAKATEAASAGKKLFGLFGGVGGQFEYHVPSNDGTSTVTRGSIENPTLADASTAALKVLSKNKKGFFLMIEQGDIDWANHANDYSGMIGGMWDLDQAIKAVEAYIDQPGDDIDWNNTMVIVTSDHGNSFMRIDMSKKLDKGKLPTQNPVTGQAFSYLYPNNEITYGADGKGVNSHFNEPVTLYAKGPSAAVSLLQSWEGKWYTGTKLIDNTHIFQAMKSALDLKDENRP